MKKFRLISDERFVYLGSDKHPNKPLFTCCYGHGLDYGYTFKEMDKLLEKGYDECSNCGMKIPHGKNIIEMARKSFGKK